MKTGMAEAHENEQFCDYIVEEADRLSKMTSSILLMVRLENLGIFPGNAVFSLDEQLRQAALTYIPICQEKEIALVMESPSIQVTGNQDLLLQVWMNLLDNAVKFTPKGGTIQVSAARSTGAAAVTIADTGIGMGEQTAKRVFDRFYQADTSRKDEGSGLGLSLVRQIVQLHQGTVRITSSPHMGSIFRVELPQSIADSQAYLPKALEQDIEALL